MAISLSNHEDRIKKLEDKTWSWNILFDDPRLLSTNKTKIGNFNPSVDVFICCFFTNSYNTYEVDSYVAILPAGYHHYVVRIWPISNKVVNYNNPNDLEEIFMEINNGEIYMWTTGRESGSQLTDNYVLSLHTLKLYYSFSYNIIYKELETMLNHFLSFLRGDTLWRYHHQA